MKFSTKGRYALRLMTELSRLQTNDPVRLKELAQKQDISDKYAEQIFSIMRRGGLVKAARGTQGGYMLLKPAEEITVGMILRLTEGDIAPIPCLENQQNGCNKSSSCATLKFWKMLYEAISSVVDQVTLKDLSDLGDTLSCDFNITQLENSIKLPACPTKAD